MRPYLLPIFLLLLANTTLSAQNALFLIRGTVVDETGQALAGVSVRLDDTTGTRTDAAGRYRLELNQLPEALYFRYVGYFSQRVKLLERNFKDGVFVLDVRLVPQETMLRELTISKERVTTIAEEDFTRDILDFEFAGDNLLLLVRERKKHFVELQTEDGRLISRLQVSGSPWEIFKSCTGALHLIGPEYAQELTLSGQQPDTFPRYSRDRFYKFVEPCVLLNQEHYFFKARGVFHQSLTYLYFDPKGKRHVLMQIMDEEGMARAMDFYRQFQTGEALFIQRPRAPGMTQDLGLLPMQHETDEALTFRNYSFKELAKFAEGYEQFAHLTALENASADSVYAPLFAVNDTLLIFDHLNNRLIRFDVSMTGTNVSPISYHRTPGLNWTRELIQDETEKTIYAHFTRKEHHTLQRIEWRGFSPSAEALDIQEAPYLSRNFRIRNGNLYYLGRPNYNIPNYKLYRLRLR